VSKKTELADKFVNAMKKENTREETIGKKEALGLMSDKREDVVIEDVEEERKQQLTRGRMELRRQLCRSPLRLRRVHSNLPNLP
jgi:hypothetical protein